MNRYYYKAVNLDGNNINGIYEAENEKELYGDFRKKGFYIIDFKIKSNKFKVLKKRVNDRELSVFFKQFSLIIKSGINIGEGLEILCTQMSSKILRSALVKIKNNVNKGKSLYSSFRYFSTIFPEFSISMIAVGEQSGNLELICMKLSKHYEFEYKLKKRITAAMSYPILLFVTSMVVLNILIIGVIPKFSKILISLNGELPLITKIILNISKFMIESKNYIFCCIILLLGAAVYFKNKRKYILEDIKLEVPFIKKIYIKLSSIKILNSLGILMSSGISIVKGINIIMTLVQSKKIKKKILNLYENINSGSTFAKACIKSNLFEPFIISMISLGEESGNLDEMLIESSDILNSDLEGSVKKISEMLCPALIIFLAVLIGIIIISVVIPMLDVMNSI